MGSMERQRSWERVEDAGVPGEPAGSPGTPASSTLSQLLCLSIEPMLPSPSALL